MLYVGGALARFQARNPRVKIELLLVDRAVNPLEEGFDVALGGLPVSFSGVLDLPLCQYDRVLVAAPAYLADNPAPRSRTISSRTTALPSWPIGLEWSFESDQGAIVVEIRARFTANDSQVLLTAALAGLGITVAPRFLAREALAAGRLVAVLADYPLPPLWFKAMVPRQAEQARGGRAGRAPEGRVRLGSALGSLSFPTPVASAELLAPAHSCPTILPATGGRIAC